MWFSPEKLDLKSKPVANSAKTANYHNENTEISKISEISNRPVFEKRKDEQHKLAELAELAGHKNLLVACYTPDGEAIQIMAKDPEHAQWLMKMNPKPNGGVKQ